MIKTMTLSTILVCFATASIADGYSTNTGVVVDVQPIYSTQYTQQMQEQCFQAQVPVYQQNPGSPADALAGAIIGGTIGNQFGGGSGKDAMTVLGAIIGADQASRPSTSIAGYVTEWRCEMTPVNVETSVFQHYEVTYKSNGKHYRINTDRYFYIGDRITIK